MVEIQFVDGTMECIECGDDSFEYDSDFQCFKVLEINKKNYACFPREFVKSIRYIET